MESKEVFSSDTYPEYKMVLIPYIWEEWHSARVNIDDKDYLLTQVEAEWRIDECRDWWSLCRLRDEIQDYRKKQGKRVWFIKYPEGDNSET